MPNLRKGKPKKFTLDGLFLPELDLLMAMDGGSISGIARENGWESLLKSIEALGRRTDALSEVWDLSDRAKRSFDNIWKTLKARVGSDALAGVDEKVHAARNGDHVARTELDNMSAWQESAKHVGQSGWWGVSVTHCAEVERASVDAVKLLRAKDYPALAHEISTNSQLSPYFPKLAISVLSRTKNDNDVLATRAAGLCEFLLAQLVLLDIKMQKANADPYEASLLPLLMRVGDDGRVKPGRNFFKWFLAEVGAKSLKNLASMAAGARAIPIGAIPDGSTLKTWSSGSSFPSARMLQPLHEALIESVTSPEQRERMQGRVACHYFLARRIDTLQDLVATLSPPQQPSDKGRLSLLDVLGAASVDDWIIHGSKRWLTHWIESASLSK